MRFLRIAAILANLSLLAAQDTFDYIVIGSGPGGGPLASNLARANYSVLLLEAGDRSTAGNAEYPPQITWDFFVRVILVIRVVIRFLLFVTFGVFC